MPSGSIPKKVEELVKEVQKGNPDYSVDKVWATAWSIYCKHVSPGNESCTRGPEGYLMKGASTEVRDLHGHEFGPRRGLEGPFRYRSGIVLYYDPREGKYYDPLRDEYLDPDESVRITAASRRDRMVRRVAALALRQASAADQTRY